MGAYDFPQAVSVDISFAPPAPRNCPHSQPIRAAPCVVSSFNPIHNDHQTPGRRHLRGKQTCRKWGYLVFSFSIWKIGEYWIFPYWDDVWLTKGLTCLQIWHDHQKYRHEISGWWWWHRIQQVGSPSLTKMVPAIWNGSCWRRPNWLEKLKVRYYGYILLKWKGKGRQTADKLTNHNGKTNKTHIGCWCIIEFLCSPSLARTCHTSFLHRFLTSVVAPKKLFAHVRLAEGWSQKQHAEPTIIHKPRGLEVY